VLTTKPGCHAPYKNLVIHAAQLPDQHVMGIRPGITGATPARTLVDIARNRSFLVAMVAADSLLRTKCIDPAAVAEVLDYCSGWPGSRKAGRVAAHASPLPENPLESASHARMIEFGIELPEMQVWIDTDLGAYRVDFLWRRFD
jgi:hypothetical protein